MKELVKRSMQKRCKKEYKSTNPHTNGAINEKNTKNVNDLIFTYYIVTDKSPFNIIIPTLCLCFYSSLALLSS